MKNTKCKSLVVLLTILSSVASFNTGWAKSVESKAKDAVDHISKSVKKEIDRLGTNVEDIQEYLNNHDWKGMVKDQASSEAVTLKHLQLNGHSNVIAVNPGEHLEGNIICDLDRKHCSPLTLYRVVLGIKGEGAQTTIGNELGIIAGESLEKFSLTAPTQPGFYQIRFRLVEGIWEQEALDAWTDKNGHEPDSSTTIGLIYVKN